MNNTNTKNNREEVETGLSPDSQRLNTQFDSAKRSVSESNTIDRGRRWLLERTATVATVALAGCLGDRTDVSADEPGTVNDSDNESPSGSSDSEGDESDAESSTNSSDSTYTEPDASCELGGLLSEDTTLGGDCTRYVVARTVNVDNGATLTVEPGVTVVFQAGTALRVKRHSRLSAVGTETDPITFTGDRDTRGSWTGVSFEESGEPNELSHVVVEYAGSTTPRRGDANVRLEGTRSSPSHLAVSNSTLRESDGYGISVDPWSVLDTFTENVVTENELGAAFVYSTSAGGLDGSTTYAGNERDVVHVEGFEIETDVTVRWPAIDTDYLVSETTRVDGGHLTISPGSTLLFRQNASIDVRRDGAGASGGLTAEGTADEPIILTGEQQTPGFWRGLGFLNSDNVDNRLSHVTVEYGGDASFYGGAAGGAPANITVTAPDYAARLSLSDVSLRDSGGDCIHVGQNATVSTERVVTEGCEDTLTEPLVRNSP